MLFDIGEKPGKATYQCANCNKFEITLTDDDEALPPCERCGDSRDVKYRQLH